ncbi:MAG: right-handed parallel beta-helix repeat-containing protein [bacterium]|nr:right-handed parallel beta-helix repeat-containing protein [bacterium]
MYKLITLIMLMLFVSSIAAAAEISNEAIQALQSKEAAGIPLTPAEKSQLEGYLTQWQLLNPGQDNSWGTDGWYTAVDQYSGGQPYNWIDISATGTEIWPLQDQDDTWSPGIRLPFTFPFYQMRKDSLYVSANVILKFNAASAPSYSTPVPSNTQPPRIDPWCYDMYHHGTDTVGASHYYYQSLGDSLFVVQFKQARYYTSTYRYDETWGKDLEVLLYSDGRIVFQYDSLRNIIPGSPYTSGIDDSVSTAGLTCGNSFSQGQAITFTPLTGVILANGQVNPMTGNTSTNFVYQIKYRNTDSFAPTSAQVYIDDVPYALIDSTYGAGNYFMGVNFYRTTTLPMGGHNFYFEFGYGSNTYRFPETGYLTGPTVYAALNGNYDIGGGTNDFPTIVQAVGALSGAGLSGPVVFTVYGGIYDGQVEFLNTIPGLSATNTVTIQAAVGVRPIVRNTTGTTSTNGNAFRFVGADYITIKGFEIDNCYYSAFYVYYATGIDSSKYITIEDNYIHDIAPTTTGYGIYAYYAKYLTILNNKIQGDYYGISLNYTTYGLVANNLVYGQDYYGIRNYYSTYIQYLYNSVYMNSVYATTNYATYWYNSTGCVLKDNIFFNGGSGSTTKYAIYLSGTLTTYPVTSDYNDLYSPNSSVGYYTAARTTLADWRTATALDAQSISADPNFVSTVAPFDLHINTAAASPVDGVGTPVPEVLVDFDYEARDAVTPDIGGDEFFVTFYNVAITPETQNGNGTPASDVAYYYMIQNGSSAPESFNLSSFGYAWPTAIYDSTGTTIINATSTIAVGGSEYVKVVHSIPGTAIGGDSDFGYLNAVSPHSPVATDTAWFFTTVIVGTAMNITPGALADTANTGETVYYDFFVNNAGSMMDDYALWTSGAAWNVTLYDSTGTAVITGIEDLAAGASYCVKVAHEVPWQPPSPLEDAGFFGAVSMTVPTIMDSSLFTTTAVIWPPARLEVTPDSANIVIPPGGGSFNFLAEVTNYGTEALELRVWNRTMLPNGVVLNLYARDFDILPGATLWRDLLQMVPAGAPAGIYQYNLYLTDLNTWVVWDSSGFSFEKLPGDGPVAHNLGWEIFGWDVDPEMSIEIPTVFDLHANFPNPFNPSTHLVYDLPEDANVTLYIYDIAGRQVAELVNGHQQAGVHQAIMNGVDLSSGIYFAVFKANDFCKVQKMLLLK